MVDTLFERFYGPLGPYRARILIVDPVGALGCSEVGRKRGEDWNLKSIEI